MSSGIVKEAVEERAALTQDHTVQDLEHRMLVGRIGDPDLSSLSWFH